VLADLVGIPEFDERVAGLSDISPVQQGGELAISCCMIRSTAGCARKIWLKSASACRLKSNYRPLVKLLNNLGGHDFSSRVSAAPEEW